MLIDQQLHVKSSELVVLPHWSGGDKCLFSTVGQTRPMRLENRFIPGGIEKLAFNLPVGNVLVTSRVAETFQKALCSTAEINELARGRRCSRQAKSPPLHLYNIVQKNESRCFSDRSDECNQEYKRKETSLILAIPNWSGGGNDVSSQQSVNRAALTEVLGKHVSHHHSIFITHSGELLV